MDVTSGPRPVPVVAGACRPDGYSVYTVPDTHDVVLVRGGRQAVFHFHAAHHTEARVTQTTVRSSGGVRTREVSFAGPELDSLSLKQKDQLLRVAEEADLIQAPAPKKGRGAAA